MPFKDGDFVLVEYSLRLRDTGQLVDTTSEEEARKEGMYEEDRIYGPQLIVIGEGRVIPGLEEAIRGMNVGEEREVEIPPEKGYGARDPTKVKTYSLKQFMRHGIYPEIGKIVEINGQVGRIVAVESGRVKVDFNHPLAGRTLVAKIKIVKKLEDDAEKIKYLAARRFNTKPEFIEVETKPQEGIVRIKMRPQAALRATPSAKLVLLDEIRRYIVWPKRVEFIETFEYREAGMQESSEKR